MIDLSLTSLYSESLTNLPDKKLLITTINAHSYNVAQKDAAFAEALEQSDVLLPDGISIVWAKRLLSGVKLHKIAGADLFYYEMKRLQDSGGTCFFLGSSEVTLNKIKRRANIEFPNVKVYSYSPPYRNEFNKKDTQIMLHAVNAVQPDVLFLGMTAPKQEKWAYHNLPVLTTGHICCIGAVFDFYAGTVQRAPRIFINLGMEWFYRLIKEPRRMWRRYLIGNVKFISAILKEKY